MRSAQGEINTSQGYIRAARCLAKSVRSIGVDRNSFKVLGAAIEQWTARVADIHEVLMATERLCHLRWRP